MFSTSEYGIEAAVNSHAAALYPLPGSSLLCGGIVDAPSGKVFGDDVTCYTFRKYSGPILKATEQDLRHSIKDGVGVAIGSVLASGSGYPVPGSSL
jgi:hypothetical protein